MSDALDEHYGYLADRVKLGRYQAAISRLVRAQHVVLDLGCGSGLLGLMALRVGAREVLFVDRGPIIEMARRAVNEAGFGDRARFFQANSYDLQLPCQADVVLCDHVGYFGFDYDILRLLADAKSRFLRPDGVLVPSRIDLKLAPIESEPGRDLVQRWCDGSVPHEYAWVATPAANAKHAITIRREDLLAKPETLGTLALGTDAADFFSWQAAFECVRDGMLDGLAGWFDCVLHDDIGMSNGPSGGERLDRPQAFLPLEKPVALRAGQRVDASIMARPHDRLLAWTVDLPDTGRRFSHSTFNGLLVEDVLRTMLAAAADR
jgi:protein arginine N-methyltransferase 1